jgi:hypothetical protein
MSTVPGRTSQIRHFPFPQEFAFLTAISSLDLLRISPGFASTCPLTKTGGSLHILNSTIGHPFAR